MAYAQDVMREIADRVAPTAKTGQRIQDDSAEVAITTCANNGAGLVRVTVTSHGFQTGNKVFIKGIVGTSEANNTTANPAWTITRITADTFDLVGSAFSTAYSSDGTVVGALIGTVDHSSITRQRLLDIYNQARQLLIHTVVKRYPGSKLAKMVGGLSVRNAALTFTTGVASKPAGFVKAFSLTDATNGRISVVSAAEYEFLRDLESSTNKFVVDLAATFTAPSGTTYIANGSGYILIYAGVTVFTLSDVIFFSGTQTSEPLDIDWIPVVVELAAMIYAGKGVAEVDGLIEKAIETVGE